MPLVPSYYGNIPEYTLHYFFAANFKQTGHYRGIFYLSGFGNNLRFQNLPLLFSKMLFEGLAKFSFDDFWRMENPLVLTDEF